MPAGRHAHEEALHHEIRRRVFLAEPSSELVVGGVGCAVAGALPWVSACLPAEERSSLGA